MSGAVKFVSLTFRWPVHNAIEPRGGWRTRVRLNRVVLAVVATAKFSRRCGAPNRVNHIVNSRSEGGQKELGSRESAAYAVNPSRREGRVFGVTCMLLCGLLALHLRAADRGCPSAPGLPCALFTEEATENSKPRAFGAARMLIRA